MKKSYKEIPWTSSVFFHYWASAGTLALKGAPLFEQPSALRMVASFVCKLFYHNTSYLAQYHNAGARKDYVPDYCCYFRKTETFTNEHYEERENCREFLQLSCQEKVGEIYSFYCEWTRPPTERCAEPVPDHSCLPEYHYLSYQKNTKRRA